MVEKQRNKINKGMLKALRGESPRERLLHRLHCVAMALSGSSASESARVFGDSPRAVAYWITQFKQHGVEGLEEEGRPGRPPTLNAVQLKRLQKFIKLSRDRGEEINAHALAAYILGEFGLSVNPHLAWRILKKLTM